MDRGDRINPLDIKPGMIINFEVPEGAPVVPGKVIELSDTDALLPIQVHEVHPEMGQQGMTLVVGQVIGDIMAAH